MFDDRKNFAYSRVLFAPNPSDSGVSLTVLASDGLIFPAPPFNATVWPEDSNPYASNAEIVRITNVVGDVFTISRHQESTTAKNIGVGWQIMAGLTAKTIDDIEAAIEDNGNDIGVNAAAIALNGAAIAALQANTTPTITSFANAQHDHTNAAGGGTLGPDAITNPYKFSAYRNAAQTPSNSVVHFDTVIFDPNGDLDVTTNVGRYTAPVDGYYVFFANLTFNITGSIQDFGVNIRVNGVIAPGGNGYAGVNMYTGATNSAACTSCFVWLDAGDYVEAAAGGVRPLIVGDPAYCAFSGFLWSRS